MKKLTLIAASIAALTIAPVAALAQDAAPEHSTPKMKGSPNADGYGKDQGRSAAEPAGTSSSSGSDMKGPPNADGAARATGAGDAK